MTARDRLEDSGEAMRVLERLGLTLGKPLTPDERLPIFGMTAQGWPAEPWRPATDEEYPHLSLRGKIAHHEGMAHLRRMEAGPMWLNKTANSTRAGQRGRPAHPDEMPPRYHELIALAKNHEAEAKRLKTHLKDRRRAA